MPKQFNVTITGYGYRTYTVDAEDIPEAYNKALELNAKQEWSSDDIEDFDFVDAQEVNSD